MAGQTPEFRLTEGEYRSANFLHASWGRSLARYGIGAAILVVILGLSAVLQNPGVLSGNEVALESVLWTAGIGVLAYLVFMLLVGLTARWLLIPWQTRRFYRQHKSLQRPRRVSWDDDFLTTESSEFNSRTPWTDFRRWRENEQVLTIYVTDRMFHVLPKRVLDKSQLADFVHMLRKKIAPRAGMKRKTSVAEVFT